MSAMSFPLLTLLIAVPMLGAGATAVAGKVLPGTARMVGLGTSLLTLLLGLATLLSYDLGGSGMQLAETYEWIGAFGVYYAVGVDGLGLLMVLLTVALVPLVLLAAWRESEDTGRAPTFFALALALESLSLAVFVATDLFLFYVVFEATLIPAYFLIGGFGKAGRGPAALKFLMFQLAGGLVLLAGVIGLYALSVGEGEPSFLLADLAALDVPVELGRWLFVAFFAAFAIKAPLFPVHTWLADTTEHATPPTSVLLVCVLDKIGTFGMLRFCLGVFPEASQWATPVVITLALISIVYGAYLAIGSDDLLRLIGLTSLSHFGFITLGIFAFNTQGAAGSVLYMVNHGVATAAFFLVAGFLIARKGTPLISRMGGGTEKAAPVLAGIFLVAGLATLGLPGLSQFVSEILVLIAAFEVAWYVGVVAVTGIVLAAVYVLSAYQRIMTGPEPPGASERTAGTPATAGRGRDLNGREMVVLGPLVAALVVFGFFPMPLLEVTNPAVETILVDQVGVEDTEPVVAPDAEPGVAPETEGGTH